jgi:hypothetical protein
MEAKKASADLDDDEEPMSADLEAMLDGGGGASGGGDGESIEQTKAVVTAEEEAKDSKDSKEEQAEAEREAEPAQEDDSESLTQEDVMKMKVGIVGCALMLRSLCLQL